MLATKQLTSHARRQEQKTIIEKMLTKIINNSKTMEPWYILWITSSQSPVTTYKTGKTYYIAVQCLQDTQQEWIRLKDLYNSKLTGRISKYRDT